MFIQLDDNHAIQSDKHSVALAFLRKDGRWEQYKWYAKLDQAVNGYVNELTLRSKAKSVEELKEVIGLIDKATDRLKEAVSEAA